MSADVVPQRVVRDARTAIAERGEPEVALVVVYDSIRGRPAAGATSVESRTRFLIFQGAELRVFVSCSRVPSGTFVTGRFVSPSWPEAVYLRRAGRPSVELRVLPHGGFESELMMMGPARLAVATTGGGERRTILWTEWITI